MYVNRWLLLAKLYFLRLMICRVVQQMQKQQAMSMMHRFVDSIESVSIP